MLLEERDLTDRAAQIEALLEEIESVTDPAMRAKVTEIVQGLLMLYGEGLSRILTIVEEHDDQPADKKILEAFAHDDLISHLLLLHDLHPVDVVTRVSQALEEVRPYLHSHGGNVELLRVEGDAVWLRLEGSCHGCPSSTMTLKLAIEEAIRKAAPELETVHAEGVAEAPASNVAFLPASDLLRKKKPVEGQQAWTSVAGFSPLADRSPKVAQVAGSPLLFCKLDETLFAYRDPCPACGQSLGQGGITGDQLACPGCAQKYDVRRAGRGLDNPKLHLEPIPLLVQGDTVKVALNGS